MFEIHISPSLQHDLGIYNSDSTFVTLKSITEKSGYFSGLSIAIRRNLQFPYCQNVILKVERIDEEMYPGWFRVVQTIQVRE